MVRESDPSPMARGLRRWSTGIPGSILGLLAIVVLPLLVFGLLDADDRRQKAMAETKVDMERFAKAIALDHTDTIDSAGNMLGILSSSAALQGGDPAACTEQLRRALAVLPMFSAISLSAPDGKVLCATREGAVGISLAGLDHFKAAVADGLPHAGGYSLGRISGRPIIALSYPMKNAEGAVTGVVTTGIEAQRFARTLERMEPPVGSNTFLFDSNGNVVARSPQEDGWVGRSILDSALFKLAGGKNAAFGEIAGFDGRRMIAVTARVPEIGQGLYVAVTVPTQVVTGPITRSLAGVVGLLIGVLAASVVVAMLAANRSVIRPVKSLLEATQRVAQGDLSLRLGPNYVTGELGHLMRGFDGMVDLLRTRETQLSEISERFRLAVEGSNDGIWDWDMRKGEIWFSPRWKGMLGYADHELDNSLDAWASVIYPEDREAALAMVDAYNSGRIPEFQAIQRFTHKDGSTRFILTRAMHLKDSAGDVVRMVGAHTDITELKAIEAELASKQALLEVIAWVQAEFISATDQKAVFKGLLDRVIAATSSGYGFIGEVLKDSNGQPYLKTFALTDIAWNEETRQLYDSSAVQGLEFRNLNTLFGAALASKDVVISNDPLHDPRRGGLPPGHPALNAFLALPLRNGDEMVGLIGVANREGGYSRELVEYLLPLTRTSGALIEARRQAARAAQANKEIHDRELRFRTLAASAPIGIFQTDAEGNCVYVNDRWCQLSGLSRQQAMGPGWAAALHPDDKPAVSAEWYRCAQAGEEFDMEYRFQRSDGTIYWVRGIASELRNDDGSISGYIGTVSDVTARRQAQQSLEDLSGFQNAVLNGASAAIIATDPAGTITLFNRAAEMMLGYHHEELIGRQTPAIIHLPEEVIERARQLSEEDGTVIEPGFEVFVRRARTRQYEEREWTYIRKDGSALPVLLSVSTLRAADDSISGYLGVAIDISARRRAERELRFSEERQRAIVENILDAIITINSSGIIQTFNRSAERIFGYSADEAVGRNVSILVPEPHRQQHDSYLENYLSTGMAKIIGVGREVEGVRKDGSTFPADLSISQVDFGGQVFFVGMARDISERKKMERMKAEFISTVSHELRTPLTAIRGTLSLINSGALGDVDPDILDLTQVAEQSTLRLGRLINDILDIEKIGSGHLKLEMAPQSLGELLARTVADNQAFADQYGVSLVLDPVETDWQVMADSDRLIQVFTNLVSNAVKFSPRGDQVRIAITTPQTGLARVSVIDHGPGISAEFRSHIFEKFTQADASDSKAKGGTGLGLSIAKGLIERMSGKVWFESEMGVGTTFHVDIPLLQKAADTPVSDQPLILVVEDDPATAQVLTRMMRHEGWQTIEATTLAEAEIQLRTHTVAAVTLDLGLPDGNGLDLVRQVKADPAFRTLPIIVVTGSDAAESCAVGVMDWQDKPIDQQRLLDSVRAAIGASERRPTILHVEDDAHFRAMVARLLAGEANVVGAARVEDAVLLAASRAFDLAIVDIGLPDGNGLDVVAYLHGANADPVPVIVLSALDGGHADERIAATLVKSRASDDELVRCVRILISRLSSAAQEQD